MKSVVILLSLMTLAACGGGDAGQDIVFETVVGPNTKAQISDLPSDLRGAGADQRYLNTQPPADMEPADASDDGSAS